MTSLLLPALLLVAGVVAPAVFCSTRSLVVLGVVLFAASVAAAALGIASGAPRYEAPHDLLIVALWLVAYRSHGLARLGTGLLLLAIFVFAFRSGYRTPVLLWIFCGAYCAALTWSFGRMLAVAIPVVAVIVVLAGGAIRDAAIESLATTRFGENVRGEADPSLLARFYEARDAVNQFERRGGPMNDVLGFGHGSTFRPVFGPIHNMTPEGVVHHIHFGPVLILYRYGMLGLGIYLWLLVKAFAAFIAQYKSSRKSAPISFTEMFFTLGLGISLLDGIMRNVLADPAFSYVLAGFLYHHLTASEPILDQQRRWAVAQHSG
jgi:hypothetical protein